MPCEVIYAFLRLRCSDENFTKSPANLLSAFVAFMHQQENLDRQMTTVLGAIALGCSRVRCHVLLSANGSKSGMVMRGFHV
jgi:hypothetical protein